MSLKLRKDETGLSREEFLISVIFLTEILGISHPRVEERSFYFIAL